MYKIINEEEYEKETNRYEKRDRKRDSANIYSRFKRGRNALEYFFFFKRLKFSFEFQSTLDESIQQHRLTQLIKKKSHQPSRVYCAVSEPFIDKANY